MPTPIAMPKLGMTMQEGRVLSWSARPGDRVARGAVVLLIESEKAEVEVEAPADGVLRHVYVEPDTTVPCGTLLAALTDTVDEAFDPSAFQRTHDRPESPRGGPARPGGAASPVASGRAAASASTPGPAVAAGSGGPAGTRPAPVTPAARALARQLGIDPTLVPGTGPDGRVAREDVEAWAARRRDLVRVGDDVSLEVPASGDGVTVLLLPGFGTDVSAFARQIPPLAERWHVAGVNPRGVGGSDAPAARAYDVATLAADAAAVVAATGSGQAAHVVGASLGAAVALEMALAHPERVRSLALLTPFVEASPRLRAVLDAWCRVAREGTPETLARMLLPWLFSPRLLADAGATARMARGLAATVARVPAATLERTAAGIAAWSGTRADRLADLRVPTLVLGGADDLLAPDASAVRAAIPGATGVVIPGAGHALALDAAAEVTAALLGHLDAAATARHAPA